MSHPYSNFIESSTNQTNLGFESLDPESGNIGRKRSLVRRDRAKRTSYTGSINRTSSYRQSFNSGRHYRDSDLQNDIPMQDLNPVSSTRLHRKMPSTKVESLNSNITEDMDPFTLNRSPVREHFGLNDEENEIEEENVNKNKNQDGFPHDPNFNEDELTPLTDENYYTAIPPKRLELEQEKKKFPYWKLYCYIVTFWAPSPLLTLCGLATKERQYAWREKIGLITFVLAIGAIIAFLTFGFTRSTCTGLTQRLQLKDISTGYVIINGRAYNLDSSSHPAAPGIPANANVCYPPVNAGGKDASFLFQNVNGNCKGLIKPRENCTIPTQNGDELAWYMPCKIIDVDGSSKPNFTFDYYYGYACHTSAASRKRFYSLDVQGDLYYTWDQISNSTRDLVVYNGHIIDMGFLDWIQTDDVTYPELFDNIKNDKTMKGYDISLLLTEPHERQAANCLVEIAKIGVVDVSTVGCIASTVVLYVSLVFVLAIVLVKFAVACYFKWFISPRQGASISLIKEMNEHDKQIDQWVDDPASSAPISTVPKKRRADYHSKIKRKGLRLSWGGDIEEFIGDEDDIDSNPDDYKPKYITMTTEAYIMANKSKKNHSRNVSKASLFSSSKLDLNPFQTNTDPFEDQEIQTLDPALVHPDAVPQPPVSWEPFGYPLIHTMCLVTCYSEDEEGIRTTVDSIATTDYPNSHKLIVIICDGLITGAGNEKSTPDMCLDLMTDLVIPKDKVQAYSYVSVAQGTKRHNMSKVYAGFYKYDDNTVPPEKQQKIPVLLIVKCGTPAELTSAKPGNRGKRDSQIILMSFLQAVTFNERMTPLQFEMLKAIWQVTGLMATMYESVLMVDADTLVYPDSLTHLDAELVKDPDIMGLCGETKIANKAQSWVTAIQVFEYYISHHQSKAFESVFGSVTCLPGCFCMYRIKSPKSLNVWVPILSNSDIVEKYSDNVLDSLHKKNLLLLGEDRYLTSLMLRAFPKRKQVFVPKAACKTVVPDKFKVLLSQRRRWINSTVHNLMELALVKDLCGAFCLSMQFVIIIELIGTLVLPASITFTLYIIIVAIVSKPTPIMSLVLMGIIFGLPALLIVVTISNLTYILWMIIYMISLPIWNFVLPTYSYWKFDDFSWGDTRKTTGGDKEGHGDGDGEFDGTQIKQMAWREFESKRLQQSQNFSTAPAMASVYDPGQHYEDDFHNDNIDIIDMDRQISKNDDGGYL